MRRLAGCALAAAVLAGPVLVLAAEPAGPPKPSPEQQKLGYFVGKWSMVGEIKENPLMPAGKMTATTECEWFEGKFAVVCREKGKGPLGPTRSLAIYGYSNEEKVYTAYGVESGPMIATTVGKGTVEGNTWTYQDEFKAGGKTMKFRFTIQTAPKSFTYRSEIMPEGGDWAPLGEGKATRK